ncbi:spore germination protein KA [Paenibacillus sp. yr247]|uniref:spore germination protein n=1 Tax=Paenibacillus sp. yr247 TaxID=1761880 RepID=UPI00087E9381|nr:spore germination protein [Paenibacillus sp. yr247]SDP22709.1 spore germination protein KA [Paenibacillus sp. yr247]
MTFASASPVDEMIHSITNALDHSPDFVHHTLHVSGIGEVHYFFIDSLVDKVRIDEFILQPLIKLNHSDKTSDELSTSKLSASLPGSSLQILTEIQSCIKSILEGHIIVLPIKEGVLYALDFSKIPYRDVTEAKIETTIRGSKEGFTEDVKASLALLRKRIKSSHLTYYQLSIGRETKTEVCLVYMNNLAPRQIIAEAMRRLETIEADSVLESAYLEEWIQDTRWTPFPQMLATERPDVVAAHLLEGAFAIVSSGSPIALIGPITFFQLFNSPEDYYERADISTLLRWLRMISFLLAIFVPSFYIATVTYHPQILPLPLLISLSLQREGVPFPAFLEALIMMITFEILREAGLRMPRVAGQAISTVGALVLGLAAVEAGLMSAAIIIVVSITAIANFVAPAYSFGIAQRIVQYCFMVLAGVLGLFGITCGILILLAHLVSLRSFGVRYFFPISPMSPKDWKDTLFRVPRPQMKSSHRFFSSRKIRR